MAKKSLWQKIYSPLGFWRYYEDDGKNKYLIIYWCCFPRPLPWFRKFDLLKIRIGKSDLADYERSRYDRLWT